ncbi:putative membrane protein [Bosea sp. LC85]|uniref:DUF418 domain-containing protein n=1 Tax=Bosea sp. LC85 TaxID=1502851 RepID=UPI0004E3A167|nr:DUF418 domain-containing protein [Bosea sp. LC85]KFC73130.1 putative membrane protein [Bosea sp. LC85]
MAPPGKAKPAFAAAGLIVRGVFPPLMSLVMIVCALILLGYGLGLYGRFGPAACVLVAAVTSASLLALASLWSRTFSKGPFECFVERMAGPRRLRQ